MKMTGQSAYGRRIPVEKKRRAVGWAFLFTASALIFIFSFYPMVSALITSFKTGSSANMKWADPWYNNYIRMFKDKTFIMALKNTFLYLIIQVPVMLVLAVALGALIGEIINIEDGFERFGAWLKQKTGNAGWFVNQDNTKGFIILLED